MKKSGVLFKVLVIFVLVVMNVQSAVIYDSRQFSEIFSGLMVYQSNAEKSFDAAIECIPGTWTGATDNYWNIPTNWCDGKVPTFATNVTIPSGGRQPYINSDAYCNNLNIQAGASLTILNSNILTVSGNMVNNGTFSSNQSTVIFNGVNQEIGKASYYNLTLAGNGLKTIHNNTDNTPTYSRILSIEDRATVSERPTYDPNYSRIQYSTSFVLTTGPEWPSPYTTGSITIKGTGIIMLGNNKDLFNSSGGKGSINIEEDATLDMNGHNINKPGVINMKCGALTKGSSIVGTGILSLESTGVNVTDAGHGTKGAIIACPVKLIGSNTFTIANDATSIFTDDDLTLSISSTAVGSLHKYGSGTLNLGASEMQLEYLKVYDGHVIIPVGSQISANIETNITPSKGLCIESNAFGSGSFITNNLSGNGTVSVIRYMSPRRWHIVSSPVSGQTVGAFLQANGNIPKNTASGAPTTAPFERGMRGYNPLNNQWGNFYKEGSTESMTKGKGYLVRVKSTGDQNVTFTGTLNSGDISVTGLAAGLWNCIGNPYTSAIKINTEIATNKFLDINSANLDPLYGAIYIWHQPEAEATATGVYNESSGSYQTISNASFSFGDNPSAENEIQMGQAFIVKMAIDKTSIAFKKVMQVHKSNIELKSTNNVWPTIILKATTNSMTSSTTLAFNETMTLGLDPTYDAGLLKAGDEMSLYSILIEDADIPFAIQALPSDYESIVVPLGIDGAKDGKVSFSAELLHVPSSCHAILEDRLNSIFTDLSVNSYMTDLMGSTVRQGRFFLHTSYSTTNIDSRNRLQKLRAWAVNNQEMKIRGEVGSKANAILYDIQGRLVLSETLNAGINHTVRLPVIKPGIYILQVKEMQHTQILKLFVSE